MVVVFPNWANGVENLLLFYRADIDEADISVYRLFAITFNLIQELSHQYQWGDNCSHYKWYNGFCNFKICPLDIPQSPIWWLISKSYLRSEIANSIPIYRGRNSQNQPIPILVYGQQV